MDDRVAILVQVMSAFGRRYADAPDGLLETIFLPVIEHFTERCDARWINLVWFLPQKTLAACHPDSGANRHCAKKPCAPAPDRIPSERVLGSVQPALAGAAADCH